MFSILNIEVSLNPDKWFAKEKRLDAKFGNLTPEERALAHRERLVEARDRNMTRVRTKDNNDILVGPLGQVEQSSTPQAFAAAFQSHAIKSTPRLSYAGAPKAKRTSSLKVDSRQRTVFDAFQKFHSNAKFVAPFRNAVTTDPWDMEVDGFIKRLQTYVGVGKNDIHLVTGEIGCGKSTLLSNVVYKLTQLRLAQRVERPKGTLPIECALIDFDKIPLPTKDNYADFEGYMNDVVSRTIATQISVETNLIGSDLQEIVQQASGKHVILVFDSMDAAYHRFCTGLFVRGEELDEVANLNVYYPMVFRVIEAFVHGEFSDLGITCVFALRNDTLALFQSPGPDHGGARLNTSIDNIFSIREPDASHLKDIVARRLMLAKDCASDTHAALFDRRIQQFRRSDVDFTSLIDISVHGLRHIVNVLARVGQCVENDDMYDRFFCQEPSLRLLFYVSGKEHYSQVNEGVTNIFLVNNRYRVANNPPSVSGEKLFPEEKLSDHAHTYWLKYFILKLVQTVGTDHSTVVNLFCKTGSYDKEIVDLVLFSLSEVKHGRLIRPNVSFSSDGKVNSTGLELTTRGRRILDKNRFWDFFYLSMIVEDTWLEFPNEFAPTFSEPVGFDFIGAQTDTEYERKLVEFLVSKADTVFLFLMILEVFLSFEQDANKRLFDTLKNKRISIPDFKSIRKQCAEQVLQASSGLDELAKKTVAAAVRKNTSMVKRTLVKRKIKKSAKSVYGL